MGQTMTKSRITLSPGLGTTTALSCSSENEPTFYATIPLENCEHLISQRVFVAVWSDAAGDGTRWSTTTFQPLHAHQFSKNIKNEYGSFEEEEIEMSTDDDALDSNVVLRARLPQSTDHSREIHFTYQLVAPSQIHWLGKPDSNGKLVYGKNDSTAHPNTITPKGLNLWDVVHQDDDYLILSPYHPSNATTSFYLNRIRLIALTSSAKIFLPLTPFKGGTRHAILTHNSKSRDIHEVCVLRSDVARVTLGGEGLLKATEISIVRLYEFKLQTADDSKYAISLLNPTPSSVTSDPDIASSAVLSLTPPPEPTALPSTPTVPPAIRKYLPPFIPDFLVRFVLSTLLLFLGLVFSRCPNIESLVKEWECTGNILGNFGALFDGETREADRDKNSRSDSITDEKRNGGSSQRSIITFDIPLSSSATNVISAPSLTVIRTSHSDEILLVAGSQERTITLGNTFADHDGVRVREIGERKDCWVVGWDIADGLELLVVRL
jgi:hypothetical protein